MYQLIKADVEGGHFQLVEMEKVRRELAKFIQKQWKEIATGYSLTFDRATIIPSKDLKNGEICVPWMKEGEKVLNFRAPFLNSNGMCLSVNKLVSDRLSPDGSDLEGVIVVNDETLEQINQRIEALKTQGIETDEIVPLQTESERQARDFDGDTLGVALARDWTNLALEVESRNLPENAYAPTIKLPKQSFYNPDGTQPPFEEIAHFMSDSMPVGVTNNQVVGFVALESEVEILKQHGTKEQKLGYVLTVADHYRRLIEQAKDTESPRPLDPNYQETIAKFIKLSLDPKNINSALELNRQFYRQLIEAACFENQVAVDMFKSARAPDMELIAENRRYMYRDVNYIKDKKSPTAYLDRTIEPTGYSPVEIIINQTNRYYQESSLQSRAIAQFDQLFEGVDYSNQQKLAATQVKQDFDQVMVEAIRLEQRRQSDVGPSATFISTKGVEIEITNLVKSDFPDIWKSTGKQFNIHLKPNQTGTNHQLVAYAKLEPSQKSKVIGAAAPKGLSQKLEDGNYLGDKEGTEYLPLGTLSVDFIRELKLQPGMVTTAKLTSLKPEISQDQVQALFKSAYEIANDFRQSIPPEQLPAMAAAAWAVSTTREVKSQKSKVKSEELGGGQGRQGRQEGQGSQFKSETKKVSAFVFSAFTPEISEILSDLRLNRLHLYQLNPEAKIQGEQELEVGVRSQESGVRSEDGVRNQDGGVTEDVHRLYRRELWSGDTRIGVLGSRTAQLPVGTTGKATVRAEAYTATATIAQPGLPPVEFTIREVTKFDFGDRKFNGESLSLTVVKDMPVAEKVLLKLQGKVLGALDAASVKDLEAIDYLQDENPLKLKLESFGDTNGASGYVIGTSANGNKLRINEVGYHEYQGQKFKDTEYRRLHLHTGATKKRDAVLVDGAVVGVLHFVKDKQTLNQLGLYGKAITCSLQSNWSSVVAEIDPQSVEYPQKWIRTANVAQEQIKPYQQQIKAELSQQLAYSVKERPTLLTINPEDKVLGTVTLTFDARKSDSVYNWLVARNVEFEQLDVSAVPRETEKGLITYALIKESISPRDMEVLGHKYGVSWRAYQEQLDLLPHKPENFESIKLQPPKTTTQNPLSYLSPPKASVAQHMVKDVAMASIATQFIGKSAAKDMTRSSTRNYELAWGDRANTGEYSADDIVMISGSGNWRGVTPKAIEQTFQEHYIPLIDKALAQRSRFVVGSSQGTDMLVQKYLQSQGYELNANNEGYVQLSPTEGRRQMAVGWREELSVTENQDISPLS
ncbi:hypothetical protein, partial [Merismopedia glauca]